MGKSRFSTFWYSDFVVNWMNTRITSRYYPRYKSSVLYDDAGGLGKYPKWLSFNVFYTDLCPCGETQTMSHIVESCPLLRCFMADQLWLMTRIREEEECFFLFCVLRDAHGSRCTSDLDQYGHKMHSFRTRMCILGLNSVTLNFGFKQWWNFYTRYALGIGHRYYYYYYYKRKD